MPNDTMPIHIKNGNSYSGYNFITPTDTQDCVVTFTSSDNDATTDKTTDGMTSVATLESGETHESLFQKISKMFLNIRKLWNTVGTENISSAGQTITGAIKNLAPTDVVNYSRGDSTTIPASSWTVFGNSGKVFSKGLWIIIGGSYLYGGGVNDKYIRLTLYKSNGTSIMNSNIHIATSALEGSTILVCYVPEDSCYCLLDVYNYSNSATVNGCSIKGIKLRN